MLSFEFSRKIPRRFFTGVCTDKLAVRTIVRLERGRGREVIGTMVIKILGGLGEDSKISARLIILSIDLIISESHN